MMTKFYFFRKLPRGTNASFLALIPKKEFPEGLSDYRPISLIKSLYKIIVKVLFGRLRTIMHLLVEESQSAFWGGMQFLDSVYGCEQGHT